MRPRTVTLDYDDEAERMLTRVTLMRLGVPARVLDGPPRRPSRRPKPPL